MDKKDELGEGYSLDDFGLSSSKNFDDEGAEAFLKNEWRDLNNADSKRNAKIFGYDLNKSNANESHSYAPQSSAYINDSTPQNNNNLNNLATLGDSDAPKQAILQPLGKGNHSEIGALAVAYAILFLIFLLFMPQVYLANNIYYASKNINYLKSQREALRDENGDLQQKLESLKFNFLTLEIEEIKE